MLQSKIRGFLTRRSLSAACSIDDSSKNQESKASAAITIQSHWRSYRSRKLYKDLLLEQSAKNVQFKFFCQQVNENFFVDMFDFIFI